MADGRVDSGALLEGCKAAAKRIIHGDMAQLAEATGSVISAVLFGALAGSKALPMQRMAFEAAIHRGGVGVKESIAAFGAGFAAAEGGADAGQGRDAGVSACLLAALAPLMAEADSLRRAGADVRARSASSGWPTIRTSPTRASISTA